MYTCSLKEGTTSASADVKRVVIPPSDQMKRREKQGNTLLGSPANSAADHSVPEPWI